MFTLESMDHYYTESKLANFAKDIYSTFKLDWKKLFPSTDDLIKFIMTNGKYFNVVNPMLNDKTLYEAEANLKFMSQLKALKPNAIIMAVIILLARANGIEAGTMDKMVKGIIDKGIDTTKIKTAVRSGIGDFAGMMFDAAFASVTDSIATVKDKHGNLKVDYDKLNKAVDKQIPAIMK